MNLRPWARPVADCAPADPPPVGRAVERLVLDLARMELVGRSQPTQAVPVTSVCMQATTEPAVDLLV